MCKVPENPESGKPTTPESPFTTPMSATVPMASTLNRAATREDANAFYDKQLAAWGIDVHGTITLSY
jgi:hypothetical protein